MKIKLLLGLLFLGIAAASIWYFQKSFPRRIPSGSRRDASSERLHAIYKEGCEKGEADPCYAVGTVEEFWGNKDEAKKWFATGCRKGSGKGCLALAQAHREEGKSQAAEELFDQAC